MSLQSGNWPMVAGGRCYGIDWPTFSRIEIDASTLRRPDLSTNYS